MEGADRAEYLARVESMLTPVEVMPFDLVFDLLFDLLFDLVFDLVFDLLFDSF